MLGLNKRFRDDPQLFLENNPLQIRARKAIPSPFAMLNPNAQPPVFKFDIRPGAVGVQLTLFKPETDPFEVERPINAYWLDYEGRQVKCVIIDHRQAKFLFTPMLDGCYIGVGNGRVVHVAGDVRNNQGTAQMRNHAQTALGGAPDIGFDSNPADADQCTFVGAYHHGNWHWYVQGHEIFYLNYGGLQPIFQNGNDAGQNVIRLTDLTHG